MLVPRKSLALVGLVALSCTLGCEEETTTDDRTVNVTGIRVDPELFLGALSCADGEAESYLAELVDADTGNVLQTSDRVSCARSVVFTGVTLGASYGARVSIYRSPPSGAAGDVAWETECGLAGSGSATAANYEVVTVRECTPIDLGEQESSIVLDLSNLTASCAPTGTTVSFEVLPIDGNPLDPETLECDDATVVFDTGVEAGTTYRFAIEARDADGVVVAGTTCDATAIAGKKVASCGELTSKGSLVFDLPALVEDAEEVCGEGVDGARISIESGPLTFTQKLVSCGSTAVVSAPAGTYEGTVRLRQGGATSHVFSCTAELFPASTATFDCTLVP